MRKVYFPHGYRLTIGLIWEIKHFTYTRMGLGVLFQRPIVKSRYRCAVYIIRYYYYYYYYCSTV